MLKIDDTWWWCMLFIIIIIIIYSSCLMMCVLPIIHPLLTLICAGRYGFSFNKHTSAWLTWPTTVDAMIGKCMVCGCSSGRLVLPWWCYLFMTNVSRLNSESDVYWCWPHHIQEFFTVCSRSYAKLTVITILFLPSIVSQLSRILYLATLLLAILSCILSLYV